MSKVVVVQLKECANCRTPLRIETVGDRETAYEGDTDREHECWELPEGTEVLVMDDLSEQ